MADKSSIEWTDATWNPVTGCTEVSPGCDHCYAKTFAERWRGAPGHHFEQGFDLTLRPERLDQPLRWKRPRRIFTNSMSDLFHEQVPDEFIARVFAVMAATPQHTFQVLTKRHARMRSLLSRRDFRDAVALALFDVPRPRPNGFQWPLPNVWLGVSIEDQKWADIRVPALLDTPAAVRWLSCEPLLGPVDLGIDDPHRGHDYDDVHGEPHPPVCLICSTDDNEVRYFRREPGGHGIDWVIVGGESGPGARPMHPDWARSLRDQCVAVGVPFFFKQWGNWVTTDQMPGDTFMTWDMAHGSDANRIDEPWRVGKKAAGRLLDGRTWDEYPDTTPAVRRG